MMDTAVLDRQKTHTLVDVLLLHAEQRPDHPAIIFERDGSEPERLSYGALTEAALRVAGSLRARGTCGKPVGLLFPTGLEFTIALLGCFFSGSIAVPLAPTGRRRNRADNIQRSLRACGADLTLCSASELTNGGVAVDLLQMRESVVALDELRAFPPMEIAGKALPLPDTVAVLQYTSGSTGQPSGVMVTHGNIYSNQMMTRECFGHDEHSDFVGWAPHYHDQGLFGNIIHPLFLGATCVLLSPDSFLRRPLFWLEVIDKYRAHTSGGPNFAFDLCVDALEKAQVFEGDLSCWQNAFNGAEPIRASTLRRFSKSFAAYGFGQDVELPCYGLAECTLLTSAIRGREATALSIHVDRGALDHGDVLLLPADDPNAVEIVSCGRPVRGSTILVVDAEDHQIELDEGHVGEVLIAGAHVSPGYWQDTAKTGRTFGYTLQGREETFLRSGDLGFLHQGELFVISRVKDLIILRGRNIYPADVEGLCRDISPELSSNAIAAFSLFDGREETLALAIEVSRSARNRINKSALKKTIRAAVVQKLGIAPKSIFFARPGAVPLTTSGKIMRGKTKLLVEQGTLALA